MIAALIILGVGLAAWWYWGNTVQIDTNGTNQKLDASDIMAFAENAGFAAADLVTAIAIALAESSGNTRAYNPESAANAPTGKGSFGLWQIYLNAHPEFSSIDLFDPSENAAAAYSVYTQAGKSFTPWSTFKNSAYSQYLTAAQAATCAPTQQAQTPPSSCCCS